MFGQPRLDVDWLKFLVEGRLKETETVELIFMQTKRKDGVRREMSCPIAHFERIKEQEKILEPLLEVELGREFIRSRVIGSRPGGTEYGVYSYIHETQSCHLLHTSLRGFGLRHFPRHSEMLKRL